MVGDGRCRRYWIVWLKVEWGEVGVEEAQDVRRGCRKVCCSSVEERRVGRISAWLKIVLVSKPWMSSRTKIFVKSTARARKCDPM